MTEDLPETLWCIEANVVKAREYGEGGIDSRNGIRLFRGGAKVYIIGAYFGMCESVLLVGHHRKSVRLICSVVKAKHLENFKVKPIYKPKLREMAENRSVEQDGAYIPIKSKDEMEGLAASLPLWIKGGSK